MTEFEEFISALADAGLWSHIAEDQTRVLMRALRSSDAVTWTAGGAWRADGEDLAEGDVEAWLTSMAAALNDCDVDLHVDTVTAPYEEGSTGYCVTVNGRTLHLYTFAAGEPGSPATEDPWMDCSIKPAAEVNRLLATAGSSRRVALFWPGGNDGLAVLGEETVLRRVGEQGSWDHVIP